MTETKSEAFDGVTEPTSDVHATTHTKREALKSLGQPRTNEDAAPETKREAFKRLAERRTNAALDRIRVIGNLSNPYAYEYSDEDVRLIFVALEQELKVTRAKFQSARRREFKLG